MANQGGFPGAGGPFLRLLTEVYELPVGALPSRRLSAHGSRSSKGNRISPRQGLWVQVLIARSIPPWPRINSQYIGVVGGASSLLRRARLRIPHHRTTRRIQLIGTALYGRSVSQRLNIHA